MSDDYYNPIARLLNILKESTKGGNDNIRVFDIWKQVFGSENESDFFTSMAKLHQLIKEVEEIRDSLPEREQKLYCRELNKVKAYCGYDKLLLNRGQNKASLTPTLLQSLEIWAYNTNQNDPNQKEVILEADKISEWKTTLSELENEIVQSDIDDLAKQYFSKYINMLVQSISDYQITGADGIHDGISIMVMSLSKLQKNESKKDTEKSKSIITYCGKAIDTAFKIAVVVNTAYAHADEFKMLATNIKGLIGS